MGERLHKFMAASGVASRRKSEDLIRTGHVRVNGRIVREMGVVVDPQTDEVEVDGRLIRQQRTVVVAMNKPKGVITTMRDERGRKTVADLLPDMDVQVKPIGRLDKDTEGLLLFTSDGELAALLTHPRHGVWKTYVAEVEGVLTAADTKNLEKGVWISPEGSSGRKTAPADISFSRVSSKRERSTVEISIHEGAKHQVRLMFEALGKPVRTLRRVKFGPITLQRLAPGACRVLSKSEIDKLRASASGVRTTPAASKPKAPTRTRRVSGPKA